ncbi:MAG: hypothetical protein DRO88_02145 [Promethearchaeia archaeon]|nr:MAG: hypothetical protein DRO88_02145 [Candidatus Lokiarchaeia archaeon]
MEILEIPTKNKKIDVHQGDLEFELKPDQTNFPFKIINIVVLAKMKFADAETKIDFDQLEKNIEVKRLNRFPCVLFKIDNISIILFKNGKAIITGLKKHEQINRIAKKMEKLLRNQGKLQFESLSTEIQNLVIMSRLGKIVNLELACLTLTNCLYEPEQFPAAIVKTPHGGTFLIFSNSKIIGLGMRSMDMVRKSLKFLINEIFENDLFINLNVEEPLEDPFDDDFFF